MTKKRIAATILLAVAIVAASFGAGYVLGTQSGSTGLNSVKEAWSIIFRDYVARDRLDDARMSQAAIEGIIDTLDDPYSEYLDPETYRLSLDFIEGEFEGIGAEIGIRDERLTIIAPIENTPAEKAGIKPGDIILEIDGKPTTGMSLVEAVLQVRGPAGTPVRLLVRHEGEPEPEEIEIIRGKIDIASVSDKMMTDIAYIRITTFSMRTSEEVSQALQNVLPKAPQGIILDLRRNPGGSVQAVVEVVSYFLPEGTVTSVVDNRGKLTPLPVIPGYYATDLPLVVLVDEFSASGSEVLAGALKDYHRATIAGTTTWGKGSINILHQLKDGSGLYITTGRWLTPSGTLIEGKGIDPDYELEPEEDAIQWAVDHLKGS